MLSRLAGFLKLEPHEAWLDSAIAAMTIKSGYRHEAELIDFYIDYVKDNFVRFPDLAAGLLSYLDNGKNNRVASNDDTANRDIAGNTGFAETDKSQRHPLTN